MKEKIKRVGDCLWDMAEHNRITNYQEWSNTLYDLLAEEFPEEEKVGDHVADVEDYLHNKYSFGFCDLCGCFINYDSDPWYDLQIPFDGDEEQWLEKTEASWKKFYADSANDELQDVCDMCYHDLTTEDGFKRLPLFDDNTITTRGGKSYSNETMGEWLAEVGMKTTDSVADISYKLLASGLAPLTEKHMPFLTDWEKMRDFAKLPKDEFLASYNYLTEQEYDMTKKFWEEYHD